MFFFFFSPFSIPIALLGGGELILVIFVRLFYLYLFGFFRFSLSLGVWEGLRFVIVALPGFFSYFFFWLKSTYLFPTFRCKYDNITLEVKYF